MSDINIGEKLQTFRAMRNITLKELSNRTSLTSSMLSQIERDLVNPSINTLKTISKALDVPLFMFFKDDEDTQELVVREDSRKTIGIPDDKETRYDLLTPDTRGNIEFCIMHIPPNSTSSDFVQSHNGEETAYVLVGEVDIVVGTAPYKLQKGDSIRIPAMTEHMWRNNSGEKVEVIFAITPPSF